MFILILQYYIASLRKPAVGPKTEKYGDTVF